MKLEDTKSQGQYCVKVLHTDRDLGTTWNEYYDNPDRLPIEIDIMPEMFLTKETDLRQKNRKPTLFTDIEQAKQVSKQLTEYFKAWEVYEVNFICRVTAWRN